MKNKIPTVSIIMPVHNSGKYLPDAIGSVLNQSYNNTEIIIIDDGSTDQTKNIIKANSDSRIISIFHKKNRGITYSLNEGISRSTGKYIARMDGDDICVKDRIKTQVEFMEQNPNIDICASWIKIIGGKNDGNVWKTEALHERIIARSIFETPIAHPSIIMRRRSLKKYNIRYSSNFPYAEDYELWTRIGNILTFHTYPEVLLHYRSHSGQIGQSKSKLQQASSKRIRGLQLKKLGIIPTTTEASLHESASNWKKIDNFDSLRKWLSKVSRANRRHKIYDQFALDQILVERWYGAIYLHEKKLTRKILLSLSAGKSFCHPSLIYIIRKIFTSA